MPVNKVIVNLGLLFTFIGVAVGSVTLYRALLNRKPFLTTTSPTGTYTVLLTGQKDRPKHPFVSHQVVFSVNANGGVVLRNEYLHSGDWLDPSFDLAYPEHAWVTDQMLRFYNKQFYNKGQLQSVSVLNKTRETIRYLRVRSVDTVLLFDVQPESTTTFKVSPPRADLVWIEIEGQFAGGRQIESEGVDFCIPKGKNEPFAYYVYINENGFTIDSPDLEKLR